MSEYWISQAKYYCKTCNVYLSNDKQCILLHNRGIKHKEKADLLLKNKRNKETEDQRNQYEIKKQLDEIEKAAKEAIANDRIADNYQFYQNPSMLHKIPRILSTNSSTTIQFKASTEDIDADDNDIANDISDSYIVKGQTYLIGKKHEDKLLTGVKCEVFIESLDEWYPCIITSRIETAVPHTEVVLLSYDINYTTTMSTIDFIAALIKESMVTVDNDEEPIIISYELSMNQLKSDQFRLLVNEDGILLGKATTSSTKDTHTNVAIDENTGVGMWQTVSVREVDEEQEYLFSESERNKMLFTTNNNNNRNHNTTTTTTTTTTKNNEWEGDQDSSIHAYDPYGKHKHVYKGIQICDDSDYKIQNESISDGAIIQFKKKRKVQTSIDNTNTIIKQDNNTLIKHDNNITTLAKDNDIIIKLETTDSSHKHIFQIPIKTEDILNHNIIDQNIINDNNNIINHNIINNNSNHNSSNCNIKSENNINNEIQNHNLPFKMNFISINNHNKQMKKYRQREKSP